MEALILCFLEPGYDIRDPTKYYTIARNPPKVVSQPRFGRLTTTSGLARMERLKRGGRSWIESFLVTPLEDLQIKAPLISEDEPIITYPDTSDISASPAKKE
jgi:hypothetical protein